MGSFWFVGLVVLPHITRSPVMIKVCYPKILRLQNIEGLRMHYAFENDISLACRLYIRQIKGEVHDANYSGGKVKKSSWCYL
jgi:hypothetical protein